MAERKRRALTAAQERTFLEDGMLRLEGCVDSALARAWVKEAFDSLGWDPGRPATWTEEHKVFAATRTPHFSEAAPLLWDVVGALVGGHDRLAEPNKVTLGNGFIANFSKGADAPWSGPDPASTAGWHMDSTDAPHFLDSPEPALLVFINWTDVGPRGAGTFFAPDSVGPVARVLADHPEGVPRDGGPLIPVLAGCRRFLEFTGKAGDALVVHPFMLHRESQNHSGRPRFLTSRMLALKKPLRFDRPEKERSPVERAVLRGLGRKRLSFARRLASPSST